MNIFYILAYITGGIDILITLLNFIFPKRRTVLFFKIAADFTAAINGIFIYYATDNNLIIAGVVCCFISVIRSIIFQFRNKKKIFDNYLWPVFFSCLYMASLIFTYKNALSLLTPIGSVIATFALYLNNQKKSKILMIVPYFMYALYYGLLLKGSGVVTIFSFLSACAGLISTIIGIIIIFNIKNKDEN